MANYSDVQRTDIPGTAPGMHSNAHPTAPLASATDDLRTIAMNRISWGAVLAGVVTALVTQLLLNVLGIGIGVSTLDALRSENNPEASTFSLAAAAWWTLSGIIASYFGGLAAGRLSGRPDRSTAGWHGFVSWAAATLILFYLLSTSLGSLLGGTLNRLGSFGQAAAQAAPGLGQAVEDPFAAIEQSLRQTTGGSADPGAARDALVSAVRSAFTGSEAERRQAIDRAVEAYAAAANVSPEEARNRVNQLQTQYQQAVQQAREAADATASYVSQAAIFGVIALALGALAALFGGRSGRPAYERGARLS